MPSLKACMVTSEMLLKRIKTLQKQLGIPIINEYGASELAIAFQEPRRRMEVNAETLFVEILDDNGVLPTKGRM
jgi:phenylacetate-CoA ligase